MGSLVHVAVEALHRDECIVAPASLFPFLVLRSLHLFSLLSKFIYTALHSLLQQ